MIHHLYYGGKIGLFHMLIPSPLQAKQDLAESISTVVLQDRKKRTLCNYRDVKSVNSKI